jgi:hypothetical protein
MFQICSRAVTAWFQYSSTNHNQHQQSKTNNVTASLNSISQQQNKQYSREKSGYDIRFEQQHWHSAFNS